MYDIALNKPLKAAIKKRIYDIRQKAIANKTAKELVGCALIVPRDDLVEMIETEDSTSKKLLKQVLKYNYTACVENRVDHVCSSL